MTRSDIGLKLLSLYRDISKSHSSDDIGKTASNYSEDPDTSTVEGMTTAIIKIARQSRF